MRRFITLLLLWAALSAGLARAQSPTFLALVDSAVEVPGTNTLVPTLLVSFSNTSNSQAYVSPAFTPASNATLIAMFNTGTSTTSGVTNTGATQFTWWPTGNRQNYNTTGSPTSWQNVWVTQLPQGTAPFSMQVVISGTSAVGMGMHIVQVAGADQTAAWGTNAIVQRQQRAADATADPFVVLTAPGNNGFNTLIAWVGDGVNSTSDNNPTNGWTELAETAQASPDLGSASYFVTNAPASATGFTNNATARNWAVIALEIKAGTNSVLQ